MDDLFLITPSKKSDVAKLEDLLKALLQNDSGYLQRNDIYSEQNYNTWAIQYLYWIEEYVLNH